MVTVTHAGVVNTVLHRVARDRVVLVQRQYLDQFRLQFQYLVQFLRRCLSLYLSHSLYQYMYHVQRPYLSHSLYQSTYRVQRLYLYMSLL